MNSAWETEYTKETSAAPRKRKVRKGTQSCWECKRRKTRCIFAPSTDLICVGCKSRNTICLSQEFDEDSLVPPRKTAVKAKKKRIAAPEACSAGRHQKRVQRDHHSSTENIAGFDDFLSAEIDTEEQHLDTYRALARLWPCEQDLIVLRKFVINDTFGSLAPLSSPHSKANSRDDLFPRDLLQPLQQKSHPVLLARKLLLLSVFLQHLPGHSSGVIPKLREKATRIFDTVITLITTNDEMVHSIEGIECVALESMIHNSLGNLHRALLSLRRAIVLAQLMGLHQENLSSVSEVVDSQTRERIDFGHIWLRLVQSDRYLSLMLGVPQVCTDNTFLERTPFEVCSPIEQLERMLLIAGGRILDRNETDKQKLAVTQDIDQLLHSASTCMPPQWWLCPNSTPNNEDEQSRMGRTMLQFTYFFLLTQLHFPYLLYPSDDHFYAYSKITAVNASRDILLRFVAFRQKYNTIYCRGVDFIAFLASVALCLAHIEGRRAHLMPGYDNQGSLPFSYLAHQRMGDRGLVEQMLEYTEQKSIDKEDAIASKLVVLLRQVLAMESSSADGTILTTSFSTKHSNSGSHYSGQIGECGARFLLSIPHCGEVQLGTCKYGVEPTSSFDSLFDLDVDAIDTTWFSEKDTTVEASELGAARRDAQEEFVLRLDEDYYIERQA